MFSWLSGSRKTIDKEYVEWEDFRNFTQEAGLRNVFKTPFGTFSVGYRNPFDRIEALEKRLALLENYLKIEIKNTPAESGYQKIKRGK